MDSAEITDTVNSGRIMGTPSSETNGATSNLAQRIARKLFSFFYTSNEVR